ncbi:hypothetical protein [Mucilaginibacter sp.]|uniref:hypothetical protein n=1 Tax=Mucilaginibacter sp. TaxID=1882438 RepID=UPI003D14BAAB
MGKRHSVEKANWSSTREEWYQEECNKILFEKQSSITINDNAVYLESPNNTEHLLHITKPKTKWYEIWLKLKNN